MTLNQNKKIMVSGIIFGVIILIFAVLITPLLFKEIQKQSKELVFQKNRQAELEAKIENIKDFQASYQSYQPNLEKIAQLFINSTEPVLFIEFLEKEAINSQLLIEITPFSKKELKGDPWPSMNFQLALVGFFPDFLNFLEKIESSPYLIEVLNLNARKLAEKEGETGHIKNSLLIKVYAKE